jgi:hypothetical protein
MVINGFSVVRKPELNFSKTTEIQLFNIAPEVNGVFYEGYQRIPFGDMAERFRNKTLPDEIREAYEHVRSFRNAGLYDYFVTDSYADARLMRNYLDPNGKEYEIIGLSSKEIEKYLGRHHFDGEALFRGHDINAGGYSAVLTCFFENPNLFKEQLALMNEHGLLSTVNAALALVDRYIEIQGDGSIEEIEIGQTDIVAVYKLGG